MDERVLSRVPFELAYLALLTKYGVKRLSRWERRLSDEDVSLLRQLGLQVSTVERRTLFRKKVEEAVFSTLARYNELYKSRFHGRRITSRAPEVRFKGFIFGYPSCCVERFISHPYSKNDLDPGDQRILFHWACPGCKVTPLLLRDYRAIYAECSKIFGAEPAAEGFADERGRVESPVTLALRRRALPAAACLTGLLLFPQLGLSSDPHLLPVEDDTDSDYLSYAEEIIRGYLPRYPDINGDDILDGINEAQLLDSLIAALPTSAQTDQPYRIDMQTDGVEYCEVCAAPVDMGFVTIVNPLRVPPPQGVGHQVG